MVGVNFNNDVFKFIRILKNGAMVSGPYSGVFRRQCLEQAFDLFVNVLLPEFIAHGLSKMDKQIELLLDTTAIEDMLIISRMSPMCVHLPVGLYRRTTITATDEKPDEKTDEITYEHIFDILEMMKNGAMVSDNDKFIDEYRQVCLEQAFSRFTTDVLPDLMSCKIITCNDQYRTILINLSSISHKKDIRPRKGDICVEKFKPY